MERSWSGGKIRDRGNEAAEDCGGRRHQDCPVSLSLSQRGLYYLSKRNLIGSISSVPGLFTLKKEGNILENIIPYLPILFNQPCLFSCTIQLIDDY